MYHGTICKNRVGGNIVRVRSPFVVAVRISIFKKFQGKHRSHRQATPKLPAGRPPPRDKSTYIYIDIHIYIRRKKEIDLLFKYTLVLDTDKCKSARSLNRTRADAPGGDTPRSGGGPHEIHPFRVTKSDRCKSYK